MSAHSPTPPGSSYLWNSYVRGRKGETAVLFRAENDIVVCALDRYAIVPREEYEALLKYARHLPDCKRFEDDGVHCKFHPEWCSCGLKALLATFGLSADER